MRLPSMELGGQFGCRTPCVCKIEAPLSAALPAFLASAILCFSTCLPRGALATSNEAMRGSGVEIALSDLSSRKVACPADFYVPQKGRWDCIEISAQADNQRGRAVTAAGVFGRIRDVDGYPCLSTALDDRMQTSIASLGAIPKGVTPVKFIVAVDATAPRPLQLENFKASYSNAAIERQFAPFDRCELDPIGCALED